MLIVEPFPEFDDDVNGAVDYIAGHHFKASLRFLESIEETVRHLAAHPVSGSLVKFNDPGAQGLRVIGVQRYRNYLIYFRPLPDRIQLIRLVHGARRQRSVFKSPGDK
ncbi:type II toxin-antitoxin system RelE/ParE family toxin [Lacipirellula sp.]|uniref:type II toxin-antitoxin system RelE/ParE family toxin n=1 Tax=Lacipirellula sp. TaxID=2691419 RepID=UPI003D152525